ncbi:CvpA family protein [Saccharicrinis sp. FJH54]|uniref:CvpA family protein n=1 Tax=Saccharicrinis sp. FJH54 TaxID=3344665 RepID=UPI0035D4D743
MNYLDIIILLPLVYGVFRGFRKGFAIELATLAALILGIWGAYKFSYITTIFLRDKFDMTGDYLPYVSFFLTFILIVFLVNLLGKMLDNLLKAVSLGFINRLAGAVLGFAKLAVVTCLLVFLAHKLDDRTGMIPEKDKAGSLLYERAYELTLSVLPYIDIKKLEEKINQKKTGDKPEKIARIL